MKVVQIWLVFALLSVLCKSWFYILQKSHLDDNVSPYTTAYISSFYASLITLPLALIEYLYSDVPIDASTILVLVIFGVLECTSFYVYLFALNNLNLSIASPFKKSKPVLVGLVEPVALKSRVPISVLVSSFLATIGGILSVIGSNDSTNSYRDDITKVGIFFSLLSLVFSSIMSLVSRFGASEISPFIFGAGVSLTMLIVSRTVLQVSEVDDRGINVISKDGAMLGIVGGFRSVFVWVAYSLMIATVVSIVTQATLILDIILARYYLKEEITKTQIIGILIILIGSIVAIYTV